MSRTNFAYKLPATMTATALIATGYWNCSGREKAIVVAYEQSSKKFWKEASREEKDPRESASTP